MGFFLVTKLFTRKQPLGKCVPTLETDGIRTKPQRQEIGKSSSANRPSRRCSPTNIMSLTRSIFIPSTSSCQKCWRARKTRQCARSSNNNEWQQGEHPAVVASKEKGTRQGRGRERRWRIEADPRLPVVGMSRPTSAPVRPPPLGLTARWWRRGLLSCSLSAYCSSHISRNNLDANRIRFDSQNNSSDAAVLVILLSFRATIYYDRTGGNVYHEPYANALLNKVVRCHQ